MPTDPRPRTPLAVEATALIDGQKVWLKVGVAHVHSTPAGPKLRLKLGAIPDDREIWVCLPQTLRLDLQDGQPEAEAAAEPPSRILH